MNKNTILITIISVVAIFAFLGIVYYTTSQPAESKVFPENTKVKADDHLKWSPTKKILLVEYGDIQCPACKNLHEALKANFEASSSPHYDAAKNVTFVFRHFPLDQHENARVAAYIAEAAGIQGKFYEMVDMQYEKQTDWEKSKDAMNIFLGYAKDLKLDVEKLKKDAASDAVKKRVDEDYQLGVSSEVSATPTLYLNGKKVDLTTMDDLAVQLKAATK